MFELKTYIGKWIDSNKKRYSTRFQEEDDLCFDYFWVDYEEYLVALNSTLDKKNKIPVKARQSVESFYKTQLDLKQKLHLEVIKKAVAYIPGNESDLLEQWVEHVTGSRKPSDIAIMKHWIWQIKRKMNGLKVYNHIMPMLYELNGGGGKSEAVKRLTSPIEEYCLNYDFAKIADDRYRWDLSSYFVVWIDEMAKPEKCDIDTLKNLITEETSNQRTLGKNGARRRKQNCSFAGGSNKHLASLIVDTTNMRRFFQIDCQPKTMENGQPDAATRARWKAINEIDYVSLWQSIDETKEEGYLVGEVMAEISAHQKDLKSEDAITQFCEELSLIPSAPHDIEKQSVKNIFDNWYAFCQDSNVLNPGSRNNFSKLLRSVHNFEQWKVGSVRGVYVSKSHNLTDYAREGDLHNEYLSKAAIKLGVA